MCILHVCVALCVCECVCVCCAVFVLCLYVCVCDGVCVCVRNPLKRRFRVLFSPVMASNGVKMAI